MFYAYYKMQRSAFSYSKTIFTIGLNLPTAGLHFNYHNLSRYLVHTDD